MTKFCLFFVVINLQIYASSFSQQRINLDLRSTSLRKVFLEIEKNTDLSFCYNQQQIDKINEIDVCFKNAKIETVLDYCLKGTNLGYDILDKHIFIKKNVPLKDDKKSKIKGKVVDEKGQPLPGVTVLVKGTNVGVATNKNGVFEINVNSFKNLRLIFSFIGMETKEINVTSEKYLNVVLVNSNVSLEEVVAVGFGSKKKKDLTGSVYRIDQKLIEQSSRTSVAEIIQGQIPGVQILLGDGAPGEAAQITIRGVGTLMGDASPLIVIDEMPMGSDFDLNSLNPDDIKSIDVLKGASSAAIYGSRAAAGVIMVTTKRGKKGQRPSINYSYEVGTSELVWNEKSLTTDEWKFLLFEACKNMSAAKGQALEDNYDYKKFVTPGYFGEANTNWMKMLMQDAVNQRHNLSLRGGSKATSYNLSFGVEDDEGMLLGTSNEQYTFSLNLTTDINSSIKMGVNVRGSKQKRSNSTFQLGNITSVRPDIKPYNEDGSYNMQSYDYNGEKRFIENPIVNAKEIKSKDDRFNYSINAFLEVDLLKSLKWRSSALVSSSRSESNVFYPSNTTRGSGYYSGQSGQLDYRYYGSGRKEYETRLSYIKRIKNHSINCVLASTLSQIDNDSYTLTFTDFPDDIKQTAIYQGLNYKQGWGGRSSGSSLVSVIARADYNYASKYYLTASIRRDGSSRFSPDCRWGDFPSAAIAWAISEEDFLKDSKIFDYLKFRFALGKSGMNQVGDYSWMTLYKQKDYLDKSGVVPSSFGNESLEWETTTQFDLGIDFGLFKNSIITGSLGVYRKKSEGLLYSLQLPPSTGLGSTQINFAEVENKGIEIDLRFRLLQKRDYSWDFSFNVSRNLNKITGLETDLVSFIGSASLSNTVVKEGSSLGLFYGFKTDGIYKNQAEVDYYESLNKDHHYQDPYGYYYVSPGDIKFVDLNGDGYVNMRWGKQEDKAVLGDSNPDWTGGFATSFRYKKLTLSVNGTFSYGNMKSWTQEKNQFMFSTYSPGNVLDFALDRWTPQNTDAKYPKMKLNVYANEFTDFYLHDASYLKIQSIKLNYNVPTRFAEKIGISSMNCFVAIDNAFVITNYPGPCVESYSSDNRISSAAEDYGSYPPTRTYKFGIRINI